MQNLKIKIDKHQVIKCVVYYGINAVSLTNS